LDDQFAPRDNCSSRGRRLSKGDGLAYLEALKFQILKIERPSCFVTCTRVLGPEIFRLGPREDVKKIVGLRAVTPGSANDLLKKIRTLIKFAIDAGWRADDPTLRIKAFPEHEFHTWTEDEIAQYEEHWPIGSRERTAFALHLYTGQRRADVARMAWTDVAGNAINVVQAKTGVRLTIPLHPRLSAALRAWPRKHMVILTTAFNRPFSNAGYGNMMADAIAARLHVRL